MPSVAAATQSIYTVSSALNIVFLVLAAVGGLAAVYATFALKINQARSVGYEKDNDQLRARVKTLEDDGEARQHDLDTAKTQIQQLKVENDSFRTAIAGQKIWDQITAAIADQSTKMSGLLDRLDRLIEQMESHQ